MKEIDLIRNSKYYAIWTT